MPHLSARRATLRAELRVPSTHFGLGLVRIRYLDCGVGFSPSSPRHSPGVARAGAQDRTGRVPPPLRGCAPGRQCPGRQLDWLPEDDPGPTVALSAKTVPSLSSTADFSRACFSSCRPRARRGPTIGRQVGSVGGSGGEDLVSTTLPSPRVFCRARAARCQAAFTRAEQSKSPKLGDSTTPLPARTPVVERICVMDVRQLNGRHRTTRRIFFTLLAAHVCQWSPHSRHQKRRDRTLQPRLCRLS